LNNLNQIEKNIYNCYLKHFRKGLPYQHRKDFSNLDSTATVCLKKLNSFFLKFPHINQDDFFGAPNFLHPDEPCPPLKFFITRPAIKAYSLAMKKKEDDSPEKQLDKIKESFHFIAMFCLQNKLTLEQYLNHKTRSMPTWMEHYRQHHVNPYSLLALGDLNRYRPINEEERFMWSGDFFDRIDSYKSRFFSSEKTKNFTKEAITKIKDFLKKELQSK
jgi:hypothetical protein